MTKARTNPHAAELSKLLGYRAQLAFEQFSLLFKYSPDQPRDEDGRWTGGGGTAEDNQSNSAPTVMAMARGRAGLEKECKLQYEKDIFQCTMVGLPSCYNQAMVRYNACLRGQQIPPLNY